MKKLGIIAFLILTIIIKAQDNKSYSLVNKIIESNSILQEKDLIIYSIRDGLLLIIMDNNDIFLFNRNIERDNNFQYYGSLKPKKKDIKMIKDIFKDKGKCHSDKLTWKNYNYKVSNGNNNYFLIKSNSKNYCEFELSVVIQPTPIDANFYRFINSILFNEIIWKN
ncbi:hypothetical protein AR438_13525 [Chryseobacterium aquaticum]|uniref:Uncharacterized protein n=1 Tax=Chryseobacterium aquaticum TaxID=452084 RepID=A0A0Q3HQA4_9FLAO|nr:hypothetical protein [Chryseobacterium aquaticum]KQK24944.1 hypothetical protein AR438_13525 [Chryseobacterium aquaticum]